MKTISPCTKALPHMAIKITTLFLEHFTDAWITTNKKVFRPLESCLTLYAMVTIRLTLLHTTKVVVPKGDRLRLRNGRKKKAFALQRRFSWTVWKSVCDPPKALSSPLWENILRATCLLLLFRIDSPKDTYVYIWYVGFMLTLIHNLFQKKSANLPIKRKDIEFTFYTVLISC